MDSKTKVLTIAGVAVIVVIVAALAVHFMPESEDSEELPDTLHYRIEYVRNVGDVDVARVVFEEYLPPRTHITLMCHEQTIGDYDVEGSGTVTEQTTLGLQIHDRHGFTLSELEDGLVAIIDGHETIRTS